MHHIYCSGNERYPDGRYALSTVGSLEDIAPIADQLSVGMRVMLYEPGEFELEALLELDELGRWAGKEIQGTFRWISADAN